MRTLVGGATLQQQQQQQHPLCTCSVIGASAEHSTDLLIAVAKHFDHVHNALPDLQAVWGALGGLVAWGTRNIAKARMII